MPCISGVTTYRMTSYESDKSNLSFSEKKKFVAFLAKLGNSKHFSNTYFFGENDKLVSYKLENDKF